MIKGGNSAPKNNSGQYSMAGNSGGSQVNKKKSNKPVNTAPKPSTSVMSSAPNTPTPNKQIDPTKITGVAPSTPTTATANSTSVMSKSKVPPKNNTSSLIGPVNVAAPNKQIDPTKITGVAPSTPTTATANSNTPFYETGLGKVAIGAGIATAGGIGLGLLNRSSKEENSSRGY
jgi:hypothetical protein